MEELNQVQDTAVELPETFLGDETEAETINEEPVSEDKPVEEETQVQEVESNENDEAALTPFLTITYNKEQKGLSQDEAIEYAQKGMNYDKLYGQLESIRPLFNELTRLAQMNGMSNEDYLRNLSDVQAEFNINQEIESLKQKYPDTNEEVLRELAELQVSERQTSKANAEELKREQDESRKKEEIGRQLDKFQLRYPNVDPQSLDHEIYQLMANGYTLLEAYETIESEKREAAEKERIEKEKIIQKNEENKRKSLGNTSNAGNVEVDDFLSTFLAD